MDGPTTTTNESAVDRVQVAHLFLKAAGRGDGRAPTDTVLTVKQAETAIKRLFPDLFETHPLALLAAELLDCVERDAGRPHYSENVRSTLELIRVQLDVTEPAAGTAARTVPIIVRD